MEKVLKTLEHIDAIEIKPDSDQLKGLTRARRNKLGSMGFLYIYDDDDGDVLSPLGREKVRMGLFLWPQLSVPGIGLDRQAQWGASPSLSSGVSWIWLWKAVVPNKVKTFVWCACSNVIPTGAKLVKRGLGVVDPCAPRCFESIDHILRGCPLSKRVWALSNVPVRVWQGGADLFGWFHGVVSNLDAEMQGYMLTICWALWYNRSRWVHESTGWSPSEVVQLVKDYLELLKAGLNSMCPCPDPYCCTEYMGVLASGTNIELMTAVEALNLALRLGFGGAYLEGDAA
ncbi:hypothetical protein LguiA_018912 [Lonicera macranthoides]